jgi:hypothetical protein
MERTMNRENKRIQSSYSRGVTIGALYLLLLLHAWSGIEKGNYWKAGALSCAGVGLVIAFQPKETNED